MTGQKEKRYYILYSLASDQQNLKNKLERELVDTDSEVFIPYMEYYRRGDKAVKTKQVFPNYTFIYTGMDPMELHKMVREIVGKLQVAVRELGFKEQYYKDGLEADEFTENEVILYPSVNDEEAEFLDLLRQGNGLLTMSAGYDDGSKKYVVMEGPLKAFQDKIIDVDKHSRKAFLAFSINGSRAQAGFECKPKAYWFPKEDSRIVSLADGTEVDLEELKRSVMKI